METHAVDAGRKGGRKENLTSTDPRHDSILSKCRLARGSCPLEHTSRKPGTRRLVGVVPVKGTDRGPGTCACIREDMHIPPLSLHHMCVWAMPRSKAAAQFLHLALQSQIHREAE